MIPESITLISHKWIYNIQTTYIVWLSGALKAVKLKKLSSTLMLVFLVGHSS